ncbi:MAG: hypothetical protein ACREMA_04795 [Longimicrobiales bacterium]
MKISAIVFLAALPFLAVLPAQAQKLEPGKWTGSVTSPGEQTAMPVTFDVTLKGDTIGITVSAGEHGSFTFSEVKLADNTLTFWFSPGPRVDCKLARREDGAFAGACTDTQGGVATMVMVPPRK